jgi:hypothetical protein
VQLAAPARLVPGDVTVAIRPEDVVVSPLGQASTAVGGWPARISQLSDLGHYSKAFAEVDGFGTLKVYLPKSSPVNEGDRVTLAPTRYLVYVQDAPPIEVRANGVAAPAQA